MALLYASLITVLKEMQNLIPKVHKYILVPSDIQGHLQSSKSQNWIFCRLSSTTQDSKRLICVQKVKFDIFSIYKQTAEMWKNNSRSKQTGKNVNKWLNIENVT